MGIPSNRAPAPRVTKLTVLVNPSLLIITLDLIYLLCAKKGRVNMKFTIWKTLACLSKLFI